MLELTNRPIQKNDTQKGDTIIEVMVVLAVLGLALSISYATADQSLLNARQAQENSTGAELAQSQIESLRTLADDPITSSNYIYLDSNDMFCISNFGIVPQPELSPYTLSSFYDYEDECNTGIYHISVYQKDRYQTFEVTVEWYDVSGHGTDTVTIDYRVHALQTS
jgi:prepilin-type N-terminal cleavage/methylation domain-containing protein